MAACDEKTVYEPEDDSQWAPVVDPEDEEDQKEDQKEDGKDEGKEEDTPQKKDTIKVMSFNIRTGTSDKGTPNAWDNRKPGVYEMIKTEKPLIVGLQECHIFQRDDITSNCPDYAGFGIGRDNASETSGESCSVIYNKNLCSIEKWGSFRLSPTPDKVFLSMSHFSQSASHYSICFSAVRTIFVISKTTYYEKTICKGGALHLFRISTDILYSFVTSFGGGC